MMRGHNIVADRWVGASNANPHPMPPQQHLYKKKTSKMLIFPLFDSWVADGQTDGQTNRQTDRQTDGWTDKQSLLYTVEPPNNRPPFNGPPLSKVNILKVPNDSFQCDFTSL